MPNPSGLPLSSPITGLDNTMQKKRFILIGLCLGILQLGFSPGSAGSPAALPSFLTYQLDTPSPLVQEMIDQVDPSLVYQLTGDLSGAWPVMIGGDSYTITTRHSLSGEPIHKAGEYLFEYYQNLGLAVSLQDFTYSNTTLSNVVAEKTGSVFPERVFLITSHYDNMPSTGLAPGADDNASGTVGVMLAANILSQFDFGCTLRFVNFAAEEQGLYGSSAYTHRAHCARQDLRGALNLDMIAWNTPGSLPEVELHANPAIPGSTELADLFDQVVDIYDLNLKPTQPSPPTYASDHARFWAFNIPAILVIEDFSDFNPNYHSREDKLENIPDLAYYTEMVKASLASLAHMGCLVEDGWGTVSGVISNIDTGEPIQDAQVLLTNPTWGYTFQSTTSEGGEFTMPALAGNQILTADAFQFAGSPEFTITVSSGGATSVDVSLNPAQEQQHYLPITGDHAFAPLKGCP